MAMWVTLLLGFLAYHHCTQYEGVTGVIQNFGRKVLQESPPGKSNNDTQSEYPPELLDHDQKAAGGIVLYCIGVLYMFVFLAIVCDEFFVPALEVMVAKYDISDDVAGATLMAAGGSAPELFTSLIGVFIAKSSVGFGTIIGSAVFNVLFVIGMCAMFSKELLELTWWPLARDCSFYTVDLIVLYIFFSDSSIEWWEALIMFLLYGAYVAFMKINEPAEKFVKGLLGIKVAPSEDMDMDLKVITPAHSTTAHIVSWDPKAIDGLAHNQANPQAILVAKRTMAVGVMQMMFRHTRGVQVLGNNDTPDQHHSRGLDRFRKAVGLERAIARELEKAASAATLQNASTAELNKNKETETLEQAKEKLESNEKKEEKEEEEEEEVGLDLSWPDSLPQQVNYVLCAPIIYTLAYTVPDVRYKKYEHLWAVSFLLSILWIGFASYWMVWWATVVGKIVGLADEVMGYTFLAAGTSVPDLMSSVIVAQQGLGDMAVSSSIGSNIFDITFGLPVPWLIWTIYKGKTYVVESSSLTFSLALLIIMLVFVVFCIAISGWKMSKGLGAMMFGLYAVFLTLVLLKAYNSLGALNDI
eukprot:CAMPEP_0196580814 /NCGR_PEP_ID=MMETSP1081-20130531/30753_1 /TAXON_ID=36882 /ORGANISM="Pyramimonas amylifera, Strain CCMP720" /LENGTH=582 /DNA_ID=CAMNT_0041900809 /DNA_START=550 /DNA_END=2298 /DNA_ORIENTATION=+